MDNGALCTPLQADVELTSRQPTSVPYATSVSISRTCRKMIEAIAAVLYTIQRSRSMFDHVQSKPTPKNGQLPDLSLVHAKPACVHLRHAKL